MTEYYIVKEQAIKETSIDNRLMLTALLVKLFEKGVLTEEEFDAEYATQQKLAKDFLMEMTLEKKQQKSGRN